MTMPDKIWASEAKTGYGEWQDAQDGLPMPVPYIRADIVEELVGAMGNLLVIESSADPMYVESIAMGAMLRINAIMEGK